jgi:hypothetical protein
MHSTANFQVVKTEVSMSQGPKTTKLPILRLFSIYVLAQEEETEIHASMK